MWISPAYAQGAEADGGMLVSFLPLILIFVVFYFLLIRPQQKKAKAHKAMLGEIGRGDVTARWGQRHRVSPRLRVSEHLLSGKPAPVPPPHPLPQRLGSDGTVGDVFNRHPAQLVMVLR